MVAATSLRLSRADISSHLAEVLGDLVGILGLVAKVADSGENHASGITSQTTGECH